MGYVRALGLFTVVLGALFAPVTLAGRFLAPGDGLRQGLAAFYAPVSLWSDRLLAGFPVGADPTIQSFYPLRWLFALVGSYNAYVVSAYVGTAFFTYGFVERLTGSRLAGVVSGFAFSMCGFLIHYSAVTSMPHSVMWLPLLLWALENLRARLTPGWLGLGVLAVAAMALAGHAQMLVFAGLVVLFYVVAFAPGAGVGSWRFLLVAGAIAGLGFALAAVQLLPTAELAGLGRRAEALGYEGFIRLSLEPSDALTVILPRAFGGRAPAFIGVLPVLLALVGLARSRLRRQVMFWLGVVVITSALVVGDATPLARIVHELPLLGRFRGLSRHAMELAFATSVLAGLGIDALQRAGPRGRRWVIASAVVVGAAAGIGLMLARPAITERFAATGAQAPIFPWVTSVVIGIPLVVGLVGVVSIWWWCGLPGSRVRSASLVALVVAELASGAVSGRWIDEAPPKSVLEEPELVTRCRPLLQATGQRILPLGGGFGPPEALPANLTRLWAIDSASLYGPFVTDRVQRLLKMRTSGTLARRTFRRDNRALDLMAVRFATSTRERYERYPEWPRVGPGESWSSRAGTDAVVLFENASAMPRAWLTSEVRVLAADEILWTIDRSLFPTGEPFEPAAVALVEEPAMLGEGAGEGAGDPDRSVRFMVTDGDRVAGGRVALETRSREPSYLVLADLWYPGWQVAVDGQSAQAYRTNYIFRGVPLPPGQHEVVFEYHPRMFYIGAGVSATALVLLGVALLVVRGNRVSWQSS